MPQMVRREMQFIAPSVACHGRGSKAGADGSLLGQLKKPPSKMFLRIVSLEKGKRSRPFLPKTCLNLQSAGCLPRERVQLNMTIALPSTNREVSGGLRKKGQG